MAIPRSVHDLRTYNLSIFNVVKLKLFCMPKVREYVSILISDCDLHDIIFRSEERRVGKECS